MVFEDPVLEARRLAGVNEQANYDELYNAAEAAARRRRANYFMPPEGNPASLLPGFLKPNSEAVRPIEDVPWQSGYGDMAIESAPSAAPVAAAPPRPVAPVAAAPAPPRPPAAPTPMTGPAIEFPNANRDLETALASAYPDIVPPKGGVDFNAPNRTLEIALASAPPDYSPDAVRSRLGYEDAGRPAIDSVVSDPISGKAVQAHESTGGGGYSQTSLDKIPFDQWPESQKQALYESYQRRKVAAEAEDPMGLHTYAAKRAIDAGADIEKQNQMLSGIRAQLQQIDEEANQAARQIMASTLPQAVKDQKLAAIVARAGDAKREYQQSLGFVTGRTPSSLYQDNLGFGAAR